MATEADVRRLCLARPGVTERISWGQPARADGAPREASGNRGQKPVGATLPAGTARA